MKPGSIQEGLWDPTTGVYSRATLNVRLKEEVERAHRYGHAFSLLLLDVDHFKSVNDAFGHTRGDQVLNELAERLGRGSRRSDLVFRYGGDEFVLLLPHTTKKDSLMIANRLLKNVRGQQFAGDPPLSVSISIGAASYPEDAQTPATLFEVADRRHYLAKRGGRSRVVGVDETPEAAPILEEPSRLIERDPQLEALHNFLEALPDKKRSLLRVTGPAGTGKTAYLSEARKVARLRGFSVLSIRGSAARKMRFYGALDHARRDWTGLPRPSEGENAFTAALQRFLNNKGQAGLVITVDDIAEVDPATIRYIQALFLSSSFPPVALIYAAGPAGLPPGLPQEAPLQGAVNLSPLTPEGVGVWLRQSLKWEAPPEFKAWLHQASGGYPALIWNGLTALVEGGLLVRSDGDWTCSPDIWHIPSLEGMLEDAEKARLRYSPARLLAGQPEMVGRENELRQVDLLLQENRLVMISGPGGVGKTRLALQAAGEWVELHGGTVHAVPLMTVNQANFLIYTLGDALGFSLSGPLDPKTQLLNYLRHKNLLLVLDTFEHLREEAAILTEILEQAPEVRLLLTSREPLGISGQAVFELGSLPLPESETDDRIERSNAVQLFLNCARRSRSTFNMLKADRSYVARICRLVEGLPLGIELAATWVHSFTCQEIATQIETNLPFLASADPGDTTVEQPASDKRHSSIQAVFDSLWEMLSDSEQEIVARLSVFRSGFTTSAAYQVAGASPFFLDALLSKALLRLTFSGRKEMPELFRQYAAEKLHARPEDEAGTHIRHSDFYLSFLEQNMEVLLRGRSAMETISVEMENCKLAWDWAVEHGRLETLYRSAPAVASSYRLAGLLSEGETAMQKAKETAQKPSEDPEACQQLVVGHKLVAQVLPRLAMFQNALGKHAEAAQTGQAAIRAAQDLSDLKNLASAYLEAGITQVYQADYEAAQKLFQNGLELARQSELAQVEADILRHLGSIFVRKGLHDEGASYYNQALDLSRKIGYRAGEGTCFNNLGSVYLERGQYQESRDYFQQALEILQEAGEHWMVSHTINNLGAVSDLLGEYMTARLYADQSLRMKRDSGDRRGEGVTIGNLGFLSQRLGQYASAHTYYQQSLKISREVGYQWNEAMMLAYLGSVAFYQGRFAETESCSLQALKLAETMEDRSIQAFAHTHLGHVYTSRSNWAEAEQAYAQAITLRTALEQPHMVAECKAGLARILLGQHKAGEACRLVDEILQTMKSRGLAGCLDPFWVYLTCYQVLSAHRDTRAEAVLNNAHEELNRLASKITQEPLRRSFLEAVPSHWELLSTVKAYPPSPLG